MGADPDILQGEYDKLVGDVQSGKSGISILGKAFLDPHSKLHSFLNKNPDFIADGIGVLAQSNERKHLDLVKDIMVKHPDFAQEGLESLVSNGHEWAFDVFKDYLQDQGDKASIALLVLRDYLEEYGSQAGRSNDTKSSAMNGFRSLELRGLAEVMLNHTEHYGSHPMEMLEFQVAFAKVRNEEAFKGRHQAFTENILKQATGAFVDYQVEAQENGKTVQQTKSKPYLQSLSGEERSRMEEALQQLVQQNCVTELALKNFDRDLRSITGSGLGFEWKEPEQLSSGHGSANVVQINPEQKLP